MSSVLQGHIDLLTNQVQLLAHHGTLNREAADVVEAVAIATALLEALETAAEQPGGDQSAPSDRRSLLKRWLESAEVLLEPIREYRRAGRNLPELDRFMRGLLRVRSSLSAAAGQSSRRTLDEVERALQG